MNKLTRAEEEIMLILWKLEEATVRDVIQHLKDKDTPYTTVSTVIRVLEKKEFITHRAIGTTYLYSPVIKKRDYMKQSLSGLVNKYFEGSFAKLTSFFVSENDINLKELQQVMEDIEQDQKYQNNE